MARLERFELPTYGFVVRCSIQLSYKRMGKELITYCSKYINYFFAVIATPHLARLIITTKVLQFQLLSVGY